MNRMKQLWKLITMNEQDWQEAVRKQRVERTLTFDLADAPMLYHALLIGRTAAGMCGHKDPTIFDAMKAQVAAVVPRVSAHFKPEAWSTMIHAVYSCDATAIWFRDKAPWYRAQQPDYEMTAFVVTGDKVFIFDTRWSTVGKLTAEDRDALIEIFKENMPFNAVFEGVFGTYEHEEHSMLMPEYSAKWRERVKERGW